MADSSHRTCWSWIRWGLLFVLTVLVLGAGGCLLLSRLFESYYHGPASQKALGEGLVVEIWSSDGCPRIGERITLRATVTNARSSPLRVELKDQPVFDISIFYRTAEGEKTIHWSDGKPLTPDLTQLELKLGQSKSIEMQWVVQPNVGGVGVSAQFIDDPRFEPINPVMVLGACSGPFGP